MQEVIALARAGSSEKSPAIPKGGKDGKATDYFVRSCFLMVSINPQLINDLATAFGSQCVVVAIDAKQINGQWKVHLVGGKVPTELDLFDWAIEVAERGAGEILFTSMDHDGTKNGFANEALAQLSQIVNIPIIASGGAGTIQHFVDTFQKGKADAALAASVFHFQEIEIHALKNELKNNNIEVRI
jgi:cyclase